MADVITTLQNKGGDNVFPIAGGLASNTVTTAMLQSNAVTTAKIDDGAVTDAKLAAGAFLDRMYPVGAIFMSATHSTANAVATALGGGTWVAWGAGRVPIGMGNNGTTNYTTVEDTGGSDSNTHNHYTTFSYDGTGCFATSTADVPRSRVVQHWRAAWAPSSAALDATREDSTYDEEIDIRQPYVTVYMWKRTA